MPRKSTHIGPLLEVLPPYSSKRWLFAFEIAAKHPALKTESLHDVLRRAVEDQRVVARRKDKATGRYMYARKKAHTQGHGK